ncbi:hypothetical protein Vadar_021336 [Vaccinium darrowii]|uniref:Uncharacterized protein n=1 Tax=Vaccinium darrowii TaxID=229202 RepID=A0ACB7X2K5_9ERIC|nr:hypothetical protein Vadar_021336 [Vaccinium darrowii]
MLWFMARNGISVRGHNVLAEDKRFVPGWAQYLSSRDLWFAVDNRVNSLVRRYTGKVISWDVENENLHFNFYESVFGKDASAIFYSKAHAIDFATTLYLNEFNTIEEPGDGASSPDKYIPWKNLGATA